METRILSASILLVFKVANRTWHRPKCCKEEWSTRLYVDLLSGRCCLRQTIFHRSSPVLKYLRACMPRLFFLMFGVCVADLLSNSKRWIFPFQWRNQWNNSAADIVAFASGGGSDGQLKFAGRGWCIGSTNLNNVIFGHLRLFRWKAPHRPHGNVFEARVLY